jgi:thiol-disulfide isomerase/thioredoxin
LPSLKAFGLVLITTAALCGAASFKKPGDRKPAPDFALPNASGQTVHLSDSKGKVVLLDFWATWCAPCRSETPWLIALSQKYKNQGLAIVGVSMDDNWTPVKPYIARASVSYTILLGNNSLSASFGKLDALPVAYFLDRQGHIAVKHVGAGSRKQFEQIIQGLLSE